MIYFYILDVIFLRTLISEKRFTSFAWHSNDCVIDIVKRKRLFGFQLRYQNVVEIKMFYLFRLFIFPLYNHLLTIYLVINLKKDV